MSTNTHTFPSDHIHNPWVVGRKSSKKWKTSFLTSTWRAFNSVLTCSIFDHVKQHTALIPPKWVFNLLVLEWSHVLTQKITYKTKITRKTYVLPGRKQKVWCRVPQCLSVWCQMLMHGQLNLIWWLSEPWKEPLLADTLLLLLLGFRKSFLLSLFLTLQHH